MSVYNTHNDATIIVAHSNNKARPITAEEFEVHVNKVTNTLNQFNANVVAYKVDNTPAWLVLDAATSATNKVAVPIAHFFSEQQTHHVLSQCAATLFISDTVDTVQGELIATVVLFELYPLYIYKIIVKKPINYFKDTHKVTFTSGSTGQPKGVCLSKTSQMQVAQSLCDKINIKNPVHLCLLPLAVLLENIAGVYAPLKNGGTVHLMPLNELGFVGTVLKQPAQLIAAIDKVKPNTLILVPELLACLVAFAEQGWQPPSSLQFIAVGGALVSDMLIAKARSLSLPVYQGYGLSEAASVVSLNTPTNDNLQSAGSVLPHIQTKIEDGQLFIKGDLFLGYLNHQPHDKNQWYATGDLVDQHQNTLFIKGRLKNLIITSMGRNISAEWPELLLLSQNGILQAVVFGEGRPFLIAIMYVSDNVSNKQLSQYIDAVNQQLPDYARIQKWHRLADPLSVQQGLLTANNRPKRNAISEQYRTVFEQFYQRGDAINE